MLRPVKKLGPMSRYTAAALAAVLSATTLTAVPVAAPQAAAQSSEGLSSSDTDQVNDAVPAPGVAAQRPVRISPYTSVQVMGDILGPYSQHVGFRSGDLGAMAPINDTEFAMIFGDSFRGPTVYQGEWMSPVGVIASKDGDTGYINIDRAMGRGEKVKSLISYIVDESGRSMLPSDVINIDGTLYLQTLWHRGLESVQFNEFYSSSDNGRTWKRAGYYYSRMNGLDDLITMEHGPDGYIYIATTSFTRSNPVYLFRAEPENLADRDSWEMLDLNSGKWVGQGKSGTSILDRDARGRPIKAGEMSLRYIDGYWVLVMFNEATLAVEVRISEELERDWNEVEAVPIAKHGSWRNAQDPRNWSQPYGGYIVPGSTINDMDIIVSQWNTGTHDRYMATQFNVKGLEREYDTGHESVPARTTLTEKKVRPPLSEPSVTVSGSSEEVETIAIILGVLAGLGLLGAFAWPLMKPALPPQLQNLLPF